jgi:WD40 repeat protein
MNNHSRYKEFNDIICQTWNSLEKINDNKIIIGGGNDFIIKVMDINDFFIQNIQNDFNCFGICNIENKGVFLVCGMSYEIAIFRSDNYEKIFVYQNAHSEYIYGINYMENGLILSYSKDSNINIWYL